MKKIAIAVCYYYAEKEYLHNEVCIPIQVGYDESHIEMGIQKDNEGDNRGDRHPYYSELSGLYWLWKNIDAEYKGLFHHRRALTIEQEPFMSKVNLLYQWFKCVIKNIFKPKEWFNLHNISVVELEYEKKIHNFLYSIGNKYMSEYDMIVPVPFAIWPISIQRFFESRIERYIFQLLTDIIADKWPRYYEFWKQTLNSRNLYYANISIMKNSLFEPYAEFIFGVLDTLEERLRDENYCSSLNNEKSMCRKFGYIGELLTNTYVLYQRENGTKIKEFCIMVKSNAKHWQ